MHYSYMIWCVLYTIFQNYENVCPKIWYAYLNYSAVGHIVYSHEGFLDDIIFSLDYIYHSFCFIYYYVLLIYKIKTVIDRI